MIENNTFQKRPKVSVIIPLYNKEEYIERTLKSIVQQTYENVECIIVDDASTDNSLKIVRQFVDSYKGPIEFHVFQHKKNKNVGGARNTGIDKATGEYIFFCDADDELTSLGIEKLVAKALEYPQADVIYGNVRKEPLDNDYYELKRYGFPDIFYDNESIRESFFELWKNWSSCVNSRLYKAKIIKDNGLYFKEGIIHEDVHWTCRFIRIINCIVFVYDYVYVRYIVPNSIMTTTNFDKSGDSWAIILKDLVCSIDEKDYLQEFKKYLTWQIYWTEKAPHVKKLRESNKIFVRKAIDHNWYDLAVFLTLGRWASGNKKAYKYTLSMIYWWLNHNK